MVDAKILIQATVLDHFRFLCHYRVHNDIKSQNDPILEKIGKPGLKDQVLLKFQNFQKIQFFRFFDMKYYRLTGTYVIAFLDRIFVRNFPKKSVQKIKIDNFINILQNLTYIIFF